MARSLSRQQARRYYDRLGRKLDSQAFYEQSGLDALCAHGRFSAAQSVFGFGCGTGRLAGDLFRHYPGPRARDRAVDISPRIAGEREYTFSRRACSRPPAGEGLCWCAGKDDG